MASILFSSFGTARRHAARRLLPALAVWLIFGGGSATADGLYLDLHGGLSVNHDADLSAPGTPDIEISYDEGVALGFAVGYAFWLNWRAEGELTIRRNVVSKSGGVAVTGDDRHFMSVIMANVFYDFHNESNWTPYIGGGIGVGTLDPTDTTDDDALDGFAYQFGAGVGYSLGQSATATLDYRLLGANVEKENSGLKSEIDYLNSSIWLGLRYQF